MATVAALQQGAATGQPVKISDLPINQLSQLKKQLDEELSHLTNSFKSLRNAQLRFKDCIKSINTGVSEKQAQKPILVPLTASLYVPGRLADAESVLVDIGTGFYVEMKNKQAAEYYERKSSELVKNLTDLEKIVMQKSDTLRLVEEVLREKVLAANAAEPANSKAS